ncbi:MAG: hypothetical protein ACFHU9_02095 [Fluviicola sp.]
MFKLQFIFFLFIHTFGFCQNEVVLSLPNSNALYVGYTNVVEMSFKKRKIKNITVECDYCDTLIQDSKIKSEWMIKAGDSTHLTLTAKRKNGKVIGKQKFKVMSPPTPTLFLDSGNAKSTITTILHFLRAKYEPHVPLHTMFVTINWEIQIGDTFFRGIGASLTDEMRDTMKKEKEGVAIIVAKISGLHGYYLVKEIFEFAIE